MEQLRRTAALSKTYEVCFGEDMVVPITQEKFLSNRNYKKKFINMLIEKLLLLISQQNRPEMIRMFLLLKQLLMNLNVKKLLL